ncbi:unnamed protein product [Mytilus coruscus]|uniref:Uncharacterized protein n=1 Tax=Mytilus coruscus TaxID=42192 RepID=A0A6J8BW82_MYTCO|nr:unnamed protein product [Mytilus coruscus]
MLRVLFAVALVVLVSQVFGKSALDASIEKRDGGMACGLCASRCPGGYTKPVDERGCLKCNICVKDVGCPDCYLDCGAGSSPKMEGGCPSCTECVKNNACAMCHLDCGEGSSPKMVNGCPSCTECVKDAKRTSPLRKPPCNKCRKGCPAGQRIRDCTPEDGSNVVCDCVPVEGKRNNLIERDACANCHLDCGEGSSPKMVNGCPSCTECVKDDACAMCHLDCGEGSSPKMVNGCPSCTECVKDAKRAAPHAQICRKCLKGCPAGQRIRDCTPEDGSNVVCDCVPIEGKRNNLIERDACAMCHLDCGEGSSPKMVNGCPSCTECVKDDACAMCHLDCGEGSSPKMVNGCPSCTECVKDDACAMCHLDCGEGSSPKMVNGCPSCTECVKDVGCVACFLECEAGSSPKMEGGCPSCTVCVKDGKRDGLFERAPCKKCRRGCPAGQRIRDCTPEDGSNVVCDCVPVEGKRNNLFERAPCNKCRRGCPAGQRIRDCTPEDGSNVVCDCVPVEGKRNNLFERAPCKQCRKACPAGQKLPDCPRTDCVCIPVRVKTIISNLFPDTAEFIKVTFTTENKYDM